MFFLPPEKFVIWHLQRYGNARFIYKRIYYTLLNQLQEIRSWFANGEAIHRSVLDTFW